MTTQKQQATEKIEADINEEPTVTTKPQRESKESAIINWNERSTTDPADFIEPIPYGYKGSRFGMTGIRIDGTREFIYSILSNIKSLTRCENADTRIEIQVQEIADRETRIPTGRWVCYLRVAERGNTNIDLMDRIHRN